MWSNWLVFCDCGFHSVCPLMKKSKRLVEASWWRGWLRGKLSLVLMIGAKLSKSLIQFCPINKWVGLYFLPIFDLRLNYGRDNEDNGDLLQKIPCTHYYIQCPQPCNRPPLTHTSTRDSWTPMGKSGSVSCGVTAPFSWVLVCTRFCLCPPRVCFPSPV